MTEHEPEPEVLHEPEHWAQQRRKRYQPGDYGTSTWMPSADDMDPATLAAIVRRRH